MKNNSLKRLCAVISVLLILLTPITALAALPAPDWVQTELNQDGSKTVTLTTPTYMLGMVDYYEYSTDGFLTQKKLSNPEGGELIINETSELSIRYYSNGILSPVFTLEVVINKNTVINCPSTNISVVIQENSSIPTDISVSAFEIVNGNDYIKAHQAMDGLSFRMYYVSVTRNSKPYSNQNEDFIYLFPAEDFDVRFTKVFTMNSNGKTEEINSYGEFNVMACQSSETGIFIVAEDKRYSTGDLNGDGLVQANDARTALRIAALLENCTEIQLNAGDINKNGKIDASDARKILRFASKIDII